MLKVIPVEEAIGMPLAHDITEIVPGKHKGPAFRRGHIVRREDISKLLDVGKRHLYVMELDKDELHEEDAARRLAKAAAGPNLQLTEPVEGRVNLVAEIPGLLKIDADLLYRFNSLGDLMMATLPSNRYVRQGDVVAGTRTIPVVVKESSDSASRNPVQGSPHRANFADAGTQDSFNRNWQRGLFWQNQGRFRTCGAKESRRNGLRSCGQAIGDG